MNSDPLVLIRARRSEIKAERRRLDDEDRDLDSAERTILRLTTLQSLPQNNDGIDSVPKTQKDFVLYTLKRHRGGWYENIKDLREAVAANGKDISMSSFQPLISDMVNGDKTLLRDGPKVGLATKPES